MKLLIYASESSGASTFCYFLGQLPGSLAVIDLWSEVIMPPIDTKLPIVAKATATAVHTAADHIASFAPDRTILFIRDPVAVFSSLRNYHYANDGGTVEEKMARFDEHFGAEGFDLVLRYEDFVARDPALITAVSNLGWPCSVDYYALARPLAEIREANSAASPWLRENYSVRWGFGNIKEGGINSKFAERTYPEEVVAKVAEISPRLSHLYRGVD